MISSLPMKKTPKVTWISELVKSRILKKSKNKRKLLKTPKGNTTLNGKPWEVLTLRNNKNRQHNNNNSPRL
jgi:hypothetical protein